MTINFEHGGESSEFERVFLGDKDVPVHFSQIKMMKREIWEEIHQGFNILNIVNRVILYIVKLYHQKITSPFWLINTQEVRD